MEYITDEAFRQYSNRIDAENDRQNKRLAKLEDTVEKIQSLTVSVEKMAVSIDTMAKEISKQGVRLENIEKKPADNWNKLLWVIGTAIVGAVIGYILGGFGL